MKPLRAIMCALLLSSVFLGPALAGSLIDTVNQIIASGDQERIAEVLAAFVAKEEVCQQVAATNPAIRASCQEISQARQALEQALNR